MRRNTAPRFLYWQQAIPGARHEPHELGLPRTAGWTCAWASVSLRRKGSPILNFPVEVLQELQDGCFTFLRECGHLRHLAAGKDFQPIVRGHAGNYKLHLL